MTAFDYIDVPSRYRTCTYYNAINHCPTHGYREVNTDKVSYHTT